MSGTVRLRRKLMHFGCDHPRNFGINRICRVERSVHGRIYDFVRGDGGMHCRGIGFRFLNGFNLMKRFSRGVACSHLCYTPR